MFIMHMANGSPKAKSVSNNSYYPYYKSLSSLSWCIFGIPLQSVKKCASQKDICASYLSKSLCIHFFRRYYEAVSSLLFTMAVFIIAVGPLSLTIVNYGVTFMFTVITLQQLFDKEDKHVAYPQNTQSTANTDTQSNNHESNRNINNECNENIHNDKSNARSSAHDIRTETQDEQCDPCNESRIYNVFKRLKDKLSVDENVP